MRCIAERRDVMYETVMSHPSKIAELQQAKTVGYQIAIHFVATDDPSRYGRTMAFAPIAIGYADQALVFDNSNRGADGGLQLQAQLVGQKLELMTEKPAKWVGALLGRVNDRADELSRIQDDAGTRAMPLNLARLDGGQTQGPIEVLGPYYAIQQDLQTKALIVHDRTLLPADLQVEQGRSYRTGYREGVGKVEALGQDRQPVAPPALPG